jgi:hypothetical protein
MGCTLYSVILKLTDEDAARVSTYCEEHNLRVSRHKRDDKSLPNRYTVWGTKLELQRFGQYF